MSSLASPRPTRRERREQARAARLATERAAAARSAYLSYRELFDIHAICQWCVVSAVLMTLRATACVTRTLQADDAPGSAEPGR
jgi:Vitamin K epoxide reductase family